MIKYIEYDKMQHSIILAYWQNNIINYVKQLY